MGFDLSNSKILTKAAIVSGGDGGFGGDGSPFCNNGSASMLPPPPEFSDVFEPGTVGAVVLKQVI